MREGLWEVAKLAAALRTVFLGQYAESIVKRQQVLEQTSHLGLPAHQHVHRQR